MIKNRQWAAHNHVREREVKRNAKTEREGVDHNNETREYSTPAKRQREYHKPKSVTPCSLSGVSTWGCLSSTGPSVEMLTCNYLNEVISAETHLLWPFLSPSRWTISLLSSWTWQTVESWCCLLGFSVLNADWLEDSFVIVGERKMDWFLVGCLEFVLRNRLGTH